MKPVRAGQLDKRLELQTKNITESPNYSYKESWSTTDTVWAKIEPKLTGSQTVLGGTIESTNRYVITIRYRDDIETIVSNQTKRNTIRGYWNNTVFNFISVVNYMTQNRILLIEAEARTHEQ